MKCHVELCKFGRCVHNRNSIYFHDLPTLNYFSTGRIAAGEGRFNTNTEVNINTEIKSIPVTKKGVYFAFRDQGACISLLAIKVRHRLMNSCKPACVMDRNASYDCLISFYAHHLVEGDGRR